MRYFYKLFSIFLKFYRFIVSRQKFAHHLPTNFTRFNRIILTENQKSPKKRAFDLYRFWQNPIIKAVDGFEPTIKLLQSRALPLGYTAITETILPKKKQKVNTRMIRPEKNIPTLMESGKKICYIESRKMKEMFLCLNQKIISKRWKNS